MKKTILIIFITLIFQASVFAKSNSKLVDEYLIASGTKEVILALPNQIEKGYLSSIEDENLKNIDIKSNFDSNQTINYFKEQLSQQFNDEQLKKIIAYYNSPLGKKFKNSSINAMDEKNSKKKILFYEQLGENTPSYERLKIMNAFVDRLELTPVAINLIGELLGSINAELATSDDTERIMNSISGQIKDGMFAASLYAYSNLSNKELKNIMGHYYTNTGRFEQKIVSEVFKQFIMASFLQILEQSQQKTAGSNIN